MRQRLVSLGEITMTLVVKRVKGHLYVYEQYRVNGRVVTKYIGPLEELARIYQIYRLEGQINYKITKRDIKRISKAIAIDVVNLLRKNEKTIKEAPGAGFEPARAPWPTGSQGQPLRPLGHPGLILIICFFYVHVIFLTTIDYFVYGFR